MVNRNRLPVYEYSTYIDNLRLEQVLALANNNLSAVICTNGDTYNDYDSYEKYVCLRWERPETDDEYKMRTAKEEIEEARKAREKNKYLETQAKKDAAKKEREFKKFLALKEKFGNV